MRQWMGRGEMEEGEKNEGKRMTWRVKEGERRRIIKKKWRRGERRSERRRRRKIC